MTAPDRPAAGQGKCWAPVVTIKGRTIIDLWNIKPRRTDVLDAIGRESWRRIYKPRGWRIARVHITEITEQGGRNGRD